MKNGKVIHINPSQARYNATEEKENNIIGSRLAAIRKENGLSLAAMSSLLSDFGVAVSGSSINKWEVGSSIMSSYQLLAVCHALNIEHPLSCFSSTYAPKLNEIGRQKLSDYEKDLIASGLYDPFDDEELDELIDFPMSFLPASAGYGQFLDSCNFEMQKFPKSAVPDGADFGVRICGDSMEPVFHNDQVAWVSQCSELSVGDVGLFVYDGEGYIKVYNEQEPDDDVADDLTDSYGVVHMQPVMVSYNCRYKPIAIRPGVEFQILGKILGAY